MTFEEFGLSEEVMQGLDAMNFQEATPVQEQTIPVILQKKDLIACAQTGTGKTAAYILPLLDLLSSQPNSRDSPTFSPYLLPWSRVEVTVRRGSNKNAD